MIDIEKFSKHLETITEEQWQQLFNLLPEMETEKEFGKMQGGELLPDGSRQMPYIVPSAVVDRFFDLVDTMQLAPIFDWVAWKEGKEILKNNTFEYAMLDTITLCKLITTIIRADRFSEGYLVGSFENGTMQKIIHALKQNRQVEGK